MTIGLQQISCLMSWNGHTLCMPVAAYLRERGTELSIKLITFRTEKTQFKQWFVVSLITNADVQMCCGSQGLSKCNCGIGE